MKFYVTKIYRLWPVHACLPSFLKVIGETYIDILNITTLPSGGITLFSTKSKWYHRGYIDCKPSKWRRHYFDVTY